MFSERSQAADIIKSYEGLRLIPYVCAGGQSTVGYGHLTSSLEAITKQEADRLLLNDINRFEKQFKKIEIKLTQNKRDALISLAFNLGHIPVDIIMNINGGNHEQLIRSWMSYRKAGNRILLGLKRRRLAELLLYYENGEDIISDWKAARNFNSETIEQIKNTLIEKYK